MNNQEAIEYMKKGGKIWNIDLPPYYFICMKNNNIFDCNDKIIEILEQKDWQEYKEADMLFFAARCESERLNRSWLF